MKKQSNPGPPDGVKRPTPPPPAPPKGEPICEWKVHTANLLKEVLANNSTHILKVPLNIFGKILAMVAERAIELDDPKLHKLMMQLTLYSMADPESEDYDGETLNKFMEKHK